MTIDAFLTEVPPRLERIEKQYARLLELLEHGRQAPAADEVGGIAALQLWGGWQTRAAAKAAIARSTELRALAFSTGGSRGFRWRKSEVLAYFERHRARPTPRLRAVGTSR